MVSNTKKSCLVKISAIIVLTAFCFTQTIFAAPAQNLRRMQDAEAKAPANGLQTELQHSDAAATGHDYGPSNVPGIEHTAKLMLEGYVADVKIIIEQEIAARHGKITDYIVLVIEALAEELITGNDRIVEAKREKVVRCLESIRHMMAFFNNDENRTAIDRDIERCNSLAALPYETRQEVLTDLRQNNLNKSNVNMVGIAVIDYLLKREYEELPSWLREALPAAIQKTKDGLVVTGDYPGTTDPQGELSRRFLELGQGGVTAEEKERLGDRAIAGGPATSTTRGLQEITRRSRTKSNTLLCSAGTDLLTHRLLEDEIGSSYLHSALLVVNPSKKHTSVTIGLEDKKGNRIFIHNVGANSDLTLYKFKRQLEDGIFDNSEVIEFGGIELSNLMDNFYEVIMALRVREKVIGNGKRFTIVIDTVVDPAHKWKRYSSDTEKFRQILGQIDIFATSYGDLEAKQLFKDAVGKNPKSAEEIVEFLHTNGAKAVFMKMGTDGSIVSTKADSVFKETRCFHMPILQGAVTISGTGTGDLYVAGVIYGFTQGWTPEKTALCATVMGGICVEHLGGTLGDNGILDILLGMQRLKMQANVQEALATAAATGTIPKIIGIKISENNGIRTIAYTYKGANGETASNELRSDRGLIHSRYIPYETELTALAACSEVRDEIKTHALLWRQLMTSEIPYVPNELRLLVFDVRKLVERFKQTYGEGPVEAIWVPSRINILGEHIDYVTYIQARVLPFASNEYGMCVIYRPRQDTKVNVASTHPDFTPQEFDVKDAPRGKNWLKYLTENGVPQQNWVNYIKGALYYLQNQNPNINLRGMDILVDSNTPAGAGASTSSILVVTGGYTGRRVNGITIDRSELGKSSAEAEWFPGTRGGAMDQTTISMGKPGQALSMRFQPASVNTVPVPHGYKFVTFYTTKHQGGSQLTSEYNERSSISRFVIPAVLAKIFRKQAKLQETWNRFKTAVETNDLTTINELISTIEENIINRLPETLTLGEIRQQYRRAYNEIAKEKEGAYKPLFDYKQNEPLMVRNLCKHHIGEVVRVVKSELLLREAALAQQQGDTATCDAKMQELGKIISETHASLRDLYRVSTDDLNNVSAITNSIKGVLGGRVIGGGFGGSYMALVRNNSVNEVISAVDKNYYQANNRDPYEEQAINIHTPGTGVCNIPTENSLAIAAATGTVNIDNYLTELQQDNSAACEELRIYYRDKWQIRRARLISTALHYKELFPAIKEAVFTRAPGRITANEHTDYNDAVALGMPTIQDDIAIVGINPDGNKIELRNMEDRFPPATFDSAQAIMQMQIQPRQNKSEVPWSEFFAAILQSLMPRLENYGAQIPGMCILVDGRENLGGVPLESNISSSAAFEESLINAIEALVGLKGRLTVGEAIEIGREAEAKIGFPCGKLDQGSSIVTRVVSYRKIMGAAIDCVPRLDENGKDKTVITPFEIPAELQAVLVNSGPKGDAQREYNIRVIEGELASWVLTQLLNELSPEFAQNPERIQQEVARLYSNINPDHNGKPYLYGPARVYPVFLKPAFFAANRLRELGIKITDAQVEEWVIRNLPDKVTMQELMDTYGLPKEFFDKVTAAAKKINIPVETISFNLRGTALHAITEEQRAPLIMRALKDAVEALTDEVKTDALRRFGELQRQGYVSLRDNYRNSTPNIDALIEWAGQQSWCLTQGSGRHFGAGWGGWVEIWVKPGKAEEAQTAIAQHLQAQPQNLMPYEPGMPASVFAQESITAASAGNITELLKDIAKRHKREQVYAIIISENSSIAGSIKMWLSQNFDNSAIVENKAQAQNQLNKWGADDDKDFVLIINFNSESIECNLPNITKQSLGATAAVTDIRAKIIEYLGDV